MDHIQLGILTGYLPDFNSETFLLLNAGKPCQRLFKKTLPKKGICVILDS